MAGAYPCRPECCKKCAGDALPVFAVGGPWPQPIGNEEKTRLSRLYHGGTLWSVYPDDTSFILDPGGLQNPYWFNDDALRTACWAYYSGETRYGLLIFDFDGQIIQEVPPSAFLPYEFLVRPPDTWISGDFVYFIRGGGTPVNTIEIFSVSIADGSVVRILSDPIAVVGGQTYPAGPINNGQGLLGGQPHVFENGDFLCMLRTGDTSFDRDILVRMGVNGAVKNQDQLLQNTWSFNGQATMVISRSDQTVFGLSPYSPALIYSPYTSDSFFQENYLSLPSSPGTGSWKMFATGEFFWGGVSGPGFDHTVRKFDPFTGQLIWEFDGVNDMPPGEPELGGGGPPVRLIERRWLTVEPGLQFDSSGRWVVLDDYGVVMDIYWPSCCPHSTDNMMDIIGNTNVHNDLY